MQQSALKKDTAKSKRTTPAHTANRFSRVRRLAPLLTFIAVLFFWQLITDLRIYPSFIIPAPEEVWNTFKRVLADGSLLFHTRITAQQMLLGLLLGWGSATLFGYAIAKNPLLENFLSPIIVAFQSTPIVAYAPLLIIWFGSGPTSKVVTSAVIVFFPTLMNTIVGIRNVPYDLREMMHSLNASPWQMFTRLEIPAALPVLLTGLKTSATLAVIGAVVGEFVSASSGLGFLVNLARNQYDTPLVFVAVITLTVLALTLYSAVSMLEWRLLAWQRRARS